MKTVLPAEAHAKLTTRLVARQDPARIQKLVAEHIMVLAPPTVRVTVDTGAASAAAVTAYDGPEVRAAMAAQRAVWGVEPVLNRNGGSLPILATFQEVLGAPFLALPLGLDDNRHAPDEHYGLEYLYKGIETVIRYYFNYAEAS
jgi:acetylornithine deacetylase/succinyl-diaminopimelate desuccinylase-like protein